MTETAAPHDTDDPATRKDGPWTTQEFVSRQVATLQRELLPPRQTAWARASLAELRRSLGHPLGSSTAVLELVINPTAPLGRSESETADERAIAAALGLYATHQQSQSTPMHVRGIRFGTAVGNLRFRDGEEVRGVTRRFQAFGTAQSWEELLHHARGLVQLLRDTHQGLDYGLLAADLVDHQRPALQDAVRLRWGRAFYRVTADPTTRPATVEEQ